MPKPATINSETAQQGLTSAGKTKKKKHEHGTRRSVRTGTLGTPADYILLCNMAKIHPSPEHYLAQRISRGQQRVHLVHCYRHDRHLVMLQELHLVVGCSRKRIDVHLIVLRSRYQVSRPGGGVATFQRKQGVGHFHTVTHSQIGQDSGWWAVCTVNDCDGRIRRVHQKARRRLSAGISSSGNESDARHATTGQLNFELEFQ
mmetsp:Transcript_2763/g.6344  ORF Transcript_2763/g.6344 Transcript_2763/m.6344 type:complete len:202 (-) Transcript_2763:4624-5229(-)